GREAAREMGEAGREGLSLWLYRVVRDEQRLNDPPRRLTPMTLMPVPLPVRLHYLVTPITSRQNLGDPDTEQYLLGKVMQCLYSHPVMSGADLRGELVGTDAQLHVRLESLDLDEIARVGDALDGSYQLSVSSDVALVDIAASLEPESHSPVVEVFAEIGSVV